jgi:hypothetical protein
MDLEREEKNSSNLSGYAAGEVMKESANNSSLDTTHFGKEPTALTVSILF